MSNENEPIKLDKYMSCIILACKGWPVKIFSEEFENSLLKLPRYQPYDPEIKGSRDYPESYISDYSRVIAACSQISGVDPEYLTMRDFNHWLRKGVESVKPLIDIDKILEELSSNNTKNFISVELFIILRSKLASLTVREPFANDDRIIFDYELIQEEDEN